jgi:metallo-beta-lactamase family protein
MHLLEIQGQRILLDCGFVQGHRREAEHRNRDLPFDPRSLHAVVLSHAHIDHSGNLPSLIKGGFEGPIYTTGATRDLCAVMLPDSAHIQAQDARWLRKKAAKWNLDVVEPIYTARDVLATMRRFITVSYDVPVPIGDGITLTFRDAAHVLGSASVVLEVKEGGATVPTRVIFSGDVGREETPLLRSPVPAWEADVLIMESTYGNRLHDPYETADAEFAATITRTVARGGKIIIPTFALERAQEVIFSLKRLLERGKIPAVPVVVDSPLTADITQVFRLHPESLDEAVEHLYVKNDSPFFFPGLRYVRRVEESKALNGVEGPMIIMSANGMCEAGRILHHLRNNIEDERNTIVFVGFQAQHTLGRRIVERQPEVKIFGRPHQLRASVVTLNALSGHADQKGLVDFARPSSSSCERCFLVHGELEQQEVLAEKLREAGFASVEIPERGTSADV